MSSIAQFRNVWAISGAQPSVLTSVTVSPNGLWLMSASQAKDMVFADFQSGTVIGTVDLSTGPFHITSGFWRTDSRLYIGSSDGQAFQIDFDPEASHPVRMRLLLKLQIDQKTSIRALAYDSLRQIIAVGCGAEVHIYSQPKAGKLEDWTCIERIPGPCEGNHGIVTALSFFGKSLETRCLFIGHAMAGFCIWKSPGSFERTAKCEKVSSIGSAMISSDERLVAIASLDQSIVTYPLGPNGPILRDQREFAFREQSEYSPIVPIALTSSNLIFKGTATGDVPVLDSMNGPMAPIQLGAKRIVRTLTTHDDKVIVGSSDAGGLQQGSRIECYSTSKGAASKDWTRSRPTFPHFKLTLDDVLQLEEHPIITELKGYLVIVKRIFVSLLRLARAVRVRVIRRKTIKVLFWTWLLTMILVIDPPTIKGLTDTAANTTAADAGATTADATQSPLDWDTIDPAPPVIYAQPAKESQGSSSKPQVPGLTYLFVYLVTFIASRFSLWGMFILALIVAGFAYCFGFLVKVCLSIPTGFIYVYTKIPEAVATAVCDALDQQGLGYICKPDPNGEQKA
ncbi:hypothetical protein FRC09_016102 [Ceratobasidium sp. 395]|nr:hypothetical protein FRC09_016102 [Ceratobasidium sp. 395]